MSDMFLLDRHISVLQVINVLRDVENLTYKVIQRNVIRSLVTMHKALKRIWTKAKFTAMVCDTRVSIKIRDFVASDDLIRCCWWCVLTDCSYCLMPANQTGEPRQEGLRSIDRQDYWENCSSLSPTAKWSLSHSLYIPVLRTLICYRWQIVKGSWEKFIIIVVKLLCTRVKHLVRSVTQQVDENEIVIMVRTDKVSVVKWYTS